MYVVIACLRKFISFRNASLFDANFAVSIIIFDVKLIPNTLSDKFENTDHFPRLWMLVASNVANVYTGVYREKI